MTDMTGPVLVIGATGRQGGAAARALLARGREVHALVRDPCSVAAGALVRAGARLVPGNLDDPRSLRAAMAGAAGVFLVLNPMTGPAVTAAGVAAELRRGAAVAQLAADTGVRQLVYSSVDGADRHTGVAHLESKAAIEVELARRNVPVTVLRPVFFMDNFASYTRPVRQDGELVVSLALRPETRLPLIASDDIGVLAAVAFEGPDEFLGRRLTIAGDDLTAAGMAQQFGRVYGMPARFQQLPLERLRAVDEEVARMFAWFDSRAAEPVDVTALRTWHPGLLTFEDWLRNRNTDKEDG